MKPERFYFGEFTNSTFGTDGEEGCIYSTVHLSDIPDVA